MKLIHATIFCVFLSFLSHGQGPILGNLNICTGSTTTLSNSVSSGAWSSSDLSIATVDVVTGVCHGFSTGTATITYTVGAGFATAVAHVHPSPAVFAVTGGGYACFYGGTVPIGLSGSQTGVDYQLYEDSDTSGSPVAGTGTALHFGDIRPTITKTYSVTATIAATGCKADMSGTATTILDIWIWPYPFYPTSRAGSVIYDICRGDSGISFRWYSSQPEVSYQLYRSRIAVGSPFIGTRSDIIVGPFSIPGDYEIWGTSIASCCRTSASTSVRIREQPTPTPYPLTGGGSYCATGTGVPLGLASSDTGIIYKLFRGTTLDTTIAGTGGAIAFGIVSDTGSYTVLAANRITTCATDMADTALVTVQPVATPSVSLALSDSGTLCAGEVLTLTAIPTHGGSAPAYYWWVNGVPATTRSTFSYTPAVGDTITTIMMSSEDCIDADTVATFALASVAPLLIPAITVVVSPSNYVENRQTTTFTATASFAGTSPAYQWVVNATPVPGATTTTYVTDTLQHGDSVSCQVVTTGDCGGYSSFNSIKMNVSSVGLATYGQAGSITLFPNPVAGTITLSGQLPGNDGGTVVATITNMLGQVVHTQELLPKAGRLQEQVHLPASLPSGNYTIRLQHSQGVTAFPFVLAR